MDTTFATDSTKRVVLDVNQVISPTLAIRAGGLVQDAGVAGRSYTTDDRSGAFVATTWKPVDAVKVTADYVHTELTGLPDFGVPYYRPGSNGSSTQQFTSTAGGPFPDYGANRNNFYGFANRDFTKTQQDIGTINGEVYITPDLMLSDKDQVFTFGVELLRHHSGIARRYQSKSALWTLTSNPQSRYQVTDVLANQSEATYKFGVDGWRHTALAGVEVSRETSYIDKYTGGTSETVGNTSTSPGSFNNVNILNPQLTYQGFSTIPQLMGLPTNLGIDTKSVYVLDSANYNDLVILNGGIRYDDYKINLNGYGTGAVAGQFGSQSAEYGLPNFNLGLTLKPAPNGSVYVAYATSSDPVGSEFDGTSAAYGGLAPVLNGHTEPDFRTGEEQGDRTRHQMGAVQPALAADGGVVPDHQGQRARSLQRQQHGNRDRQLSLYRFDGILHHCRLRLSHQGYRSRCRWQDHR